MLKTIYSQTLNIVKWGYYCLPVVSTGEVETDTIKLDSELSIVAIVMVILR